MARVIPYLEHTTTFCISRQDNFRQTTRSGHSLWVTRAIALYRIASTDIASAIALASFRMPMAPLISIFKTLLPQGMSQTGYPHRLAISYSGSASICPVKPFSTASIRCRRLSKYHDPTYESPAYIGFGRDRGVDNRHAPPHLLLAAPCEQYLHEGSPPPRIRRGAGSDQYALYGTPSVLCTAPHRTICLGLQVDDRGRQPRHTPCGWLARLEPRAASPSRARLLRPLLQCAVHRSV